MKRTWLSLLVCAAIALSVGVFAFGQETPVSLKGYSIAIPMVGNTPEQALRESEAGTTIPVWTYRTSTTVDGNVYTGQIMGNIPGITGTTTIPTFLIPLIVNMPDGGVFDPTVADPTCAGGNVPLTLMQNSPLFQNSGPFMYGNPARNIGTTQYIDALQRAEFWKIVGSSVGNSQWHTLFGLNTTTTQTVNVPAGKGATYNAGSLGGCGFIGVVDLNWLNGYVTNTLIPSLSGQGVGPTSFAEIFMYNVVMGDPGDNLFANCCVLGFHSAFGSPVQVYSPGEFDTNRLFGAASQDISVEAHEMGEAMDDPLVNNGTPAWGHIGQVSGCQNNFEVGDPLTGTQNPPITINGYTYHPQELAMYSWFLRPNIMQLPYPGLLGDTGVPSWYSTNGTFTSFQGICH